MPADGYVNALTLNMETTRQDCLTWLASQSSQYTEDQSKTSDLETFYDMDSACPSPLFSRPGNRTFFFSRTNSLATSRNLTRTTSSTITATNSHHRSRSSFTIRGRRGRRTLLPVDSLVDTELDDFSILQEDDLQYESDSHIESPYGSEELLLPIARPASSCSHLLAWRNSTVTDLQDTGHEPLSSDDVPVNRVPSSINITKEEFDALPPTIQRKVCEPCFTALIVFSCFLSFFKFSFACCKSHHRRYSSSVCDMYHTYNSRIMQKLIPSPKLVWWNPTRRQEPTVTALKKKSLGRR